MKIYKVMVNNKEIEITQDDDGKFIKPDFINEWEHYGTQLKPSYEPIIVARKPVENSIVDNVMKYGVGGINIDECRIDYNGEIPNVGGRGNHTLGDGYGFKALGEKCVANMNGRFPANLIHDGSEEVVSLFPNSGSGNNKGVCNYAGREYDNKDTSMFNGDKPRAPSNYNDNGSAARFFYCAKASKRDRDEGLEEFEEKKVYGEDMKWGYGNANGDNFGDRVASVTRKNTHPTVKPVSLMQYLVRLVSPKGSTILDPFNGSGSTGKAVMYENKDRDAEYKYIGIELTQEYLPISKARIEYAINKSITIEKENKSKNTPKLEKSKNSLQKINLLTDF